MNKEWDMQCAACIHGSVVKDAEKKTGEFGEKCKISANNNLKLASGGSPLKTENYPDLKAMPAIKSSPEMAALAPLHSADSSSKSARRKKICLVVCLKITARKGMWLPGVDGSRRSGLDSRSFGRMRHRGWKSLPSLTGGFYSDLANDIYRR